MECDFYLHKSNSTYLTDHDAEKSRLMSRLLSPAYFEYTSKGQTPPHPALAGVNAVFRRPIKPYSEYSIHTRTLTWNHTCFWVISYFVKASHCNNPVVLGYCVSRLVFKTRDGTTVAPRAPFEAAGLLHGYRKCPDVCTGEKQEDGAGEPRPNVQLWTKEDIEYERLRGLHFLAQGKTSDGSPREEICPEPRSYGGLCLDQNIPLPDWMTGLWRQ